MKRRRMVAFDEEERAHFRSLIDEIVIKKAYQGPPPTLMALEAFWFLKRLPIDILKMIYRYMSGGPNDRALCEIDHRVEIHAVAYSEALSATAIAFTIPEISGYTIHVYYQGIRVGFMETTYNVECVLIDEEAREALVFITFTGNSFIIRIDIATGTRRQTPDDDYATSHSHNPRYSRMGHSFFTMTSSTPRHIRLNYQSLYFSSQTHIGDQEDFDMKCMVVDHPRSLMYVYGLTSDLPRVDVYNTNTFRLIRSIVLKDPKYVRRMTVDADGEFILCTLASGDVWLLDASDGKWYRSNFSRLRPNTCLERISRDRYVLCKIQGE